MPAVEVPTLLAAAAERDRSGNLRRWIGGLEQRVRDVATGYELAVGPPYEPGGQTAWVAPARHPELGEVVVKIGWRHAEGAHEAAGLRAWSAEPAVQVLDDVIIDDETIVLVLEACRPGMPLSSRPEPEQDGVIASILRRVWITPPPGHAFPTLQEMCDDWATEYEDKTADRPSTLDPGLARAGVDLFRSLPGTADREVLLCTDLHAGNVLSAQREPWLLVDPKPHVGDPTYDPLQHLLNCPGRLMRDPVALTTRVAGLVDLDPDRLLLWLFARCVQESPDHPELVDVAVRTAPR